MDFAIYDPSRAHEVKKLFTDVFTDSEGREEGELIGDLAFALQDTTDPSDLYGFVARDGEAIVGCIFFSRLTFATPINAFILAPVAVATAYQGKGVGKKLIRFGIEQLQNNHVELLLTYGDPDFYAKVGFQPITEDVVKAPLPLTHPEGWLAQSLVGDTITPVKGNTTCVQALNDQRYW